MTYEKFSSETFRLQTDIESYVDRIVDYSIEVTFADYPTAANPTVDSKFVESTVTFGWLCNNP